MWFVIATFVGENKLCLKMKTLKEDSTRLNVTKSRPVESRLSVWTRLVCCVQRSAPLLTSRSICVSSETTFCRSALASTAHSSRCSRVSALHASLYAIITNNCQHYQQSYVVRPTLGDWPGVSCRRTSGVEQFTIIVRAATLLVTFWRKLKTFLRQWAELAHRSYHPNNNNNNNNNKWSN